MSPHRPYDAYHHRRLCHTLPPPAISIHHPHRQYTALTTPTRITPDAGYEYDFSRWGIPSNVEYHALHAWRLATEAAAGAGGGEGEGGGEGKGGGGEGGVPMGMPSNPKPPGIRDVKERLPPVVIAEFWQLSACLAHFKRVSRPN